MAAFEKSDLSAGTHIIYFKVQDNNGAWSKEENKTIVVAAAGSAGTPGETAGAPLIAFFNANPTYITAGYPSLLSWNVTGAAVVSIDNGIGDVAAVGSQAVTPSSTTGYTLVAKNAAGTNMARTQIVVTSAGSGPPPLAVPVINQFVSDSDTLTGSYVTLSWNVSNATSITISPGVGSVAAIGNRQVTPATTTVYTLTATNTVGSENRALQIMVPGVDLTGPGVTGTVTPLPFKVTKVQAKSAPGSGARACPFTINYTYDITTNGPGTVTYRFEPSDGVGFSIRTLNFAAASTQTVSYSWPVSGSGAYSVRCRTMAPNEMSANSVPVTVTCEGPFQVQSVSVSVTPPDYTGPCPASFTCSATITVNGAGTVTYRWERSDGNSAAQTMTFTSAGSKTVTSGWNPPTEYAWFRVHIYPPNEQVSNTEGVTNHCH